MLLAVPDHPGLLGFGCRVGDGALSCEALTVSASIPAQVLTAHLHERGKRPRVVRLDWTELPARQEAYRFAQIDIAKET